MSIPVRLSVDEIEFILAHVPENPRTHDLRIRLRTTADVALALGVATVASGPPGPERGELPDPDAGGEAGSDTEAEEDAFEPPPWPTNLPPMVTTPPYGWRRHGERIVPALEEVDVMIHILQGQRRGWSYTQIANDLNSRQLFMRSGRRWKSGGVSRVHKKSITHSANALLKERYE